MIEKIRVFGVDMILGSVDFIILDLTWLDLKTRLTEKKKAKWFWVLMNDVYGAFVYTYTHTRTDRQLIRVPKMSQKRENIRI
mgnify:CR=1 FL=1